MPKRGTKGDKPNNFIGSLKRQFTGMKKWKTPLIIAIILAATSSIFSLISPNKLSEITDAITDGLVPKTEVLELLMKDISEELSDTEKITEKTKLIMTDDKINDSSKNELMTLLSNTNLSNEEKANAFLTLPDEILEIFIEEKTISGEKISSTDQIKTLKIMSTLNKEEALASLDKLPKKLNKLVSPKIDLNYIKEIALFLFILYIISSLFGYIEHFILNTVSNKFAQSLREKISKKINILPLKYFDTHEMGDILSRVTNDIDTVNQNLNNSLSTLVSALTLFIGSIIMMFYTNGLMAITAIVSSLIGFVLMFIILSKSQKYFKQKQDELGKLNAHIEEIYSGHNIVKVYNGGLDAKIEFNKLNKQLYNSNQKSQFLSGLMPSLMSFVGNFGYVAVCIVGALLTLKGNISFGVIVAFMMYVRLFTSPLSQIAQATSGLQSATAASERVYEFLDEEEMNNEKNKTLSLDKSKVKGNIEFKNVKFGYDENRIIIKDFSAKIKSGQKVAIVGPTGAGKTTMVNLLMKFYEINDGDILIDGVSIKDLKRENIHKLFTMVLQDTWLFEGTIRDNIKFNRENITDEEIWNALKVVGVDHFVKTLSGGLDAKVDDKDSVSGGQKQLLTIARGMIEDAPFLILDEATSNVDTRTEKLVSLAMDKLTKGKTSFIIAHRLSTIKNADKILVMKDGNIIEQGTHEELMNLNGFYNELYNSQFKGNA